MRDEVNAEIGIRSAEWIGISHGILREPKRLKNLPTRIEIPSVA